MRLPRNVASLLGVAPESVTTEDYEAAWRDLSKRRVLYAITVLASVSAFIWLASELPGYRLAVFLLPAAPLLGVGFWVARFRCPRCGKRFVARTFSSSFFTRRCLHCGLTREKVS